MPRWVIASAFAIALGMAGVGACAEPESKNHLSTEAMAALRAPESVELYALEPWENDEPQLHDYHVLGKAKLDAGEGAIATAEFEASVARWKDEGMYAACFDPHHALRIAHGGHTYDFLLCYICEGMHVYRDGEQIESVAAAGFAGPLNALLQAKGLPLPRYYTDQARAEREREANEHKEQWARWQRATPRSLAERLEGDSQYRMGAVWNLPDLAPILGAEIPDRRERILALFAWFGSGAGPWSGFPSYESVPEQLLLDFPTSELVAAAQAPGLTTQQLEGAARLFAGWDFDNKRKGDIRLLPADLRHALLRHALSSDDEDKVARARHAFAD